MNIAFKGLLLYGLCGVFLPGLALAKRPIIILDAGHSPSQFGAVGTCGKTEVEYNDEIVRLLRQRLSQSFQVYLTREAGKELELSPQTTPEALKRELPGVSAQNWSTKRALLGRSYLANTLHGDVFISIHHDSTARRHQIPDSSRCADGKKLSAEFKNRFKIGYNVFVWDAAENKQRTASVRLAQKIGSQLSGLPLPASNYHLLPDDDCKSCRVVDKEAGVWHQELAVLKHARMPAVLIEVGNIIDPDQEQLLRSPKLREAFADRLERALKDWFAAAACAHGN